MENTNSNQQNQVNEDASKLLQGLVEISQESLDKSATIKANELIDGVKAIVNQYTQKDTLGEQEIKLIKNLTIYSLKPIIDGLPKESLNSNEKEAMFLKNIIYFWNKVISTINEWNP